MNSSVLMNVLRFFLLLLAQILIFNKIDFYGYINPYPYVLFILLFPVNGNKYWLLLSSFAIGIIMDTFMDSGGVHALACTALAFLRPSIFKFAFGLSYEYQTVKIYEKLSPERFTFITISVLAHHFIIFVLEVFEIDLFLGTLLRIIVSSVFTIIICILIIYMFKPNKR